MKNGGKKPPPKKEDDKEKEKWQKVFQNCKASK